MDRRPQCASTPAAVASGNIHWILLPSGGGVTEWWDSRAVEPIIECHGGNCFVFKTMRALGQSEIAGADMEMDGT